MKSAKTIYYTVLILISVFWIALPLRGDELPRLIQQTSETAPQLESGYVDISVLEKQVDQNTQQIGQIKSRLDRAESQIDQITQKTGSPGIGPNKAKNQAIPPLVTTTDQSTRDKVIGEAVETAAPTLRYQLPLTTMGSVTVYRQSLPPVYMAQTAPIVAGEPFTFGVASTSQPFVNVSSAPVMSQYSVERVSVSNGVSQARQPRFASRLAPRLFAPRRNQASCRIVNGRRICN